MRGLVTPHGIVLARWLPQSAAGARGDTRTPARTRRAPGISAIEANAAVTESSVVPLNRNANFLLLMAGQFISQIGDSLAWVAFPWLVYEDGLDARHRRRLRALHAAGSLLRRRRRRAGRPLRPPAPHDRHGRRAGRARRAGPLVAAAWWLPSLYVHELRDRDRRACSSSRPGWPSCPRSSPGGVCSAPTPSSPRPRTSPRSWAGRSAACSSPPLVPRWRSGWTRRALRPRPPASPSCATGRRARGRGAHRARGSATSCAKVSGFLRHHRGLLINTLMAMAAAAGIGATAPLTFFLAIQVFGGTARDFGWLEASMGIGYFAGSLALARSRHACARAGR